MMDMMGSTTGSAAGFTALWAVHILSVVAFFAGVLLLVLWAVKTLTAAQLKTWGIGLAVAGTIACLLTIGVKGSPWIGGWGGMMKCGGRDRMPMMQMMNGMMDGDASGMHDAMDMSMDDMSAMLDGKSGDAFDQAFIEGMIPHHQGAIDMAEMALQNAKHEEIKAMARAIIAAQQKEIDEMRQWYTSWGYTE